MVRTVTPNSSTRLILTLNSDIIHWRSFNGSINKCSESESMKSVLDSVYRFYSTFPLILYVGRLLVDAGEVHVCVRGLFVLTPSPFSPYVCLSFSLPLSPSLSLLSMTRIKSLTILLEKMDFRPRLTWVIREGGVFLVISKDSFF